MLHTSEGTLVCVLRAEYHTQFKLKTQLNVHSFGYFS